MMEKGVSLLDFSGAILDLFGGALLLATGFGRRYAIALPADLEFLVLLATLVRYAARTLIITIVVSLAGR